MTLPLIEHILFPVDFSHSCTAMAHYVKRAAAVFSARVTLIHVAEFDLFTGIELGVRSQDEIASDQMDVARQHLDSYLLSDFPISTTTRLTAFGDAATQIVQAANNIRASMIIMPTHAGSFRLALLGSTTAKVLNDANCPVLTSRHAETIAPRPIEHREWLCALGLSHDSERVLRFTSSGSAQANSHISIIHAVQEYHHDLAVEHDLQDTIESMARNRATKKLNELKQKVGVEAEVRIALGNVKEALLDAVSQSDADVLIIGRNPHYGPMGRLRDLTYAVVRDSPYPVLSV